MELKQKKTSKAWEHLEYSREMKGDLLIEFAEEHKLIKTVGSKICGIWSPSNRRCQIYKTSAKRCNEENLKICLKIHIEKMMTNIDTADNIQMDGTEIEKVTNHKYLGQAIAMENNKATNFDKNKSRMEWGFSVK